MGLFGTARYRPRISFIFAMVADCLRDRAFCIYTAERPCMQFTHVCPAEIALSRNNVCSL